MKTNAISLLAGLLLAWTTLPAPGAGETTGPGEAASASSYKLVSGDTISITVPNEPNLTGDFTVSDGKIKLWLLNEVSVAGLSFSQLEVKLNGMLEKDYIKEPSVRVSPKIFRKRLITVTGEVTKPGPFEFTGEKPVKIPEAIANANGFTKLANKKNIIIIRGDKKLFFNYVKYTTEPGYPTLTLEDGDVVDVPATFL